MVPVVVWEGHPRPESWFGEDKCVSWEGSFRVILKLLLARSSGWARWGRRQDRVRVLKEPCHRVVVGCLQCGAPWSGWDCCRGKLGRPIRAEGQEKSKGSILKDTLQ